MNKKNEKLEEKAITKDLYFLGLKVFWRTSKQVRNLFWVILATSTFLGISATYVKLVSGHIIDAFTEKDFKTALLWTMVTILILSLETFAQKLVNYYRAKFGSTVYRVYENELNKKLLRVSAKYIKEKNIGKISTIIGRGIFGLDTVGSNFLMSLLAPLISAVIGLVTIFVISWIFGIAVLLGVIVYSLILYFYNPKAVHAQRTIREFNKKYSEHNSDIVSNLFSVKQNVSEEVESEELDRWYKENRILAEKNFAINSDMLYWQGFSKDFTQALFWFAGIYFVFFATDFKIGTMVALISMYYQVFTPVDTIANRWKSFVNALVDLEAAEELYDEPEEDYNESGILISEQESQKPLVLENISFSYPDAPDVAVLKNISLTINPCEVIALVSTSGGGKSTLFDLLYRLYEPTNGTIKYGNARIQDFKLTDYRKQFAIVPQDISLFNTTLKKNIMYGSEDVSTEQLEKVLRETSMEGFVAKLPEGLDTLVGDKGMKLSGGQKQRVAICRSFLRNPKILLMDEPTSALDAETEQVIQNALADLFVGKTVIVAAHRLATIKKANRIVVLKDGEIIEIGSHEELLEKENGEYKKLYELQVGLY